MRIITLLLILLLSFGCDDESTVDSDAGVDASQDSSTDIDSATDADAETDGEVPTAFDPACDPLDPSACALPWPSNHFLRENAATDTGYSLTFDASSLPHSAGGTHLEPSALARFDGYSVGTSLLVHFENLDISALPTESTIGASLEESASIVLLEVTQSGTRRVPYWVELDAREPNASNALLLIRPAEILRHNTRYVVGMRNLSTQSGETLSPSTAFRLLRDGEAANHEGLSDRIPRFEEVFTTLSELGWSRSSLVLAWDFVTASSSTAHGDMLSMLSAALAQTGESGPPITITDITEYAQEDDGSGLPVDPLIQYRVEGILSAPYFLISATLGGYTGDLLSRDASGLPLSNTSVDVPFVVLLPRDNGSGEHLSLMQCGHGFFGSHNDIISETNRQLAYDNQIALFGTTLLGFGEADASLLEDVMGAPETAQFFTEKLEQGVLNALLLTRSMRERFFDLSEISSLGLDSDSSNLFYSSGSLGGLYGATILALSPDIDRGHLGNAGQNFGLLLERSDIFTLELARLATAYPARQDQAIVLQLLLTLWQTTDPVSYMRPLLTEPFSMTSTHEVLMTQAKGDFTTANITNEITMRSLPAVSPLPYYGRDIPLVTEVSYPHMGSGVVTYDLGTDWAASGNLTPTGDPMDNPHEALYALSHLQEQVIQFLHTGNIIDVCGGDGCTPQ